MGYFLCFFFFKLGEHLCASGAVKMHNFERNLYAPYGNFHSFIYSIHSFVPSFLLFW